MTVDEVKRRIEAIAAESHDDERAHSDEDLLYEDVLQAIARGAPDPAQLAVAVLKTKELGFERWCA